jgi:hypothetical protein
MREKERRPMDQRGGGAAWVIGEYVMASGHCPIRDFLGTLSGRHREDATALLQFLRERGAALRLPHSKPLETGLFELRGHQVRIFYTFRPGRRIVLLDGMIKKRDEIPRDVVKRVRRYLKEVQALADEARG